MNSMNQILYEMLGFRGKKKEKKIQIIDRKLMLATIIINSYAIEKNARQRC